MHDLDDEPATDFEVLLSRLEQFQATLDDVKSLIERIGINGEHREANIGGDLKDIINNINGIDLQFSSSKEDIYSALSSIYSNINLMSESCLRSTTNIENSCSEIRDAINATNSTTKQLLYVLVVGACGSGNHRDL